MSSMNVITHHKVTGGKYPTRTRHEKINDTTHKRPSDDNDREDTIPQKKITVDVIIEVPSIRITYAGSIEPITMDSGVSIPTDDNLTTFIHPIFLEEHTILKTPPDGNCLWHSISINLTGSTRLTKDHRCITRETLQHHKELFIRLIARQGNTDTSFDDVCRRSITNYEWGNEYHLLAMAIALRRPIFVYSIFKSSENRYFFDRASKSELINAFCESRDGTRQHLVYLPITVTHRSPLMCFFHQQHYSAIIRMSETSVLFPPPTNLFQNQMLT